MNFVKDKINLGFSFRTGQLSDLDVIMILEERNWPPARRVDKLEFVKRLKKFPQGFLLLFGSDDNIAGTSTAFRFTEKYRVKKLNETPSKTTLHNPQGEIYYLHAISVDKDYRGRGLGRTYVMEHEKNAKKLGCKSVYLIAAEEESVFYEKLGYKRTSEYFPYKDTEMAEFEKILTE